MAKGAWVMRTAVMVSILAHASLIGAAGLRKAAPAPDEPPQAADLLAGTTALPADAEELHEVDVLGGSAAQTPPAAPPAPPAAPAGQDDDEAPAEPPKPPVAQDKPVTQDKPSVSDEPAPKPVPKVPAKPKPVADKPETPEPKDEGEADKTPDAAPESPAPKPKPDEAKEPAPVDQDKPVAQGDRAPEPNKRPARTARRRKPSPAAAAAASSADAAPEAASPGGSAFGVDGATSIRNLGRAFAHALPPACDSDKTWGTLAVGNAGSLELAVIVGEDGKVMGVEPITTNPPAHLVNAAKRTVANIRRSLAVLGVGSVNPGKHVLRISAKLSDVTVTEEEASGAAAFGLSSDWEGRKGTASFTQPSGRHVEIVVEFVRVLPLDK
ncbi:MAG: hypothetical protein IPM54_03500 [Polyangiaceae bacterium]|nr:hypothetical protein [Polyangiaceae bacterium]